MSVEELQKGLQNKRLYQGVYVRNDKNPSKSFIKSPQINERIYFRDLKHENRAMHNSVVIFQITGGKPTFVHQEPEAPVTNSKGGKNTRKKSTKVEEEEKVKEKDLQKDLNKLIGGGVEDDGDDEEEEKIDLQEQEFEDDDDFEDEDEEEDEEDDDEDEIEDIIDEE